MTIQEELEIYQRMLKSFRKQYWNIFKIEYLKFPGFCYYLSTKLELWNCNKLTILSSLKPIRTHSYSFWFKPYKMSPRIKLLKKAIKICKQQLKSEKYE